MRNLWYKRVISVVTVMAMVIGGTVTASATTNAENEFPVQFEGIDQDGNNTTFSGFMKEGVPVPFVDTIEYMNKVYSSENVFSLSSQGNGIYEISNAKGNMIIDVTKDTLHSDRIEQFLYNDQKQDPANTAEYIYEHIISTDYRSDPSALDIDFSKYGIDII